MKTKEAMEDVMKLADKTDDDTHIFAVVVTVGKDNIAAANVAIKGDITVIAQTLGQAIQKHTKLRDAMMLDALASMMESNQEKQTLN